MCATIVDEIEKEDRSRTGEKRHRDDSWDLGLSDSVLAAGLFSADDTLLNYVSPRVKKSKK